jgi:hypothetical protein
MLRKDVYEQRKFLYAAEYYFKKTYKNTVAEEVYRRKKLKENENKFSFELEINGEIKNIVVEILEEEITKKLHEEIREEIKINKKGDKEEVTDYLCYITPERFIIYNIKSEEEQPEEDYKKEKESIEYVNEKIKQEQIAYKKKYFHVK